MPECKNAGPNFGPAVNVVLSVNGIGELVTAAAKGELHGLSAGLCIPQTFTGQNRDAAFRKRVHIGLFQNDRRIGADS